MPSAGAPRRPGQEGSKLKFTPSGVDLLTSPYAVRAKTLATSEGCLRAIYQIMNLNLNLNSGAGGWVGGWHWCGLELAIETATG